MVWSGLQRSRLAIEKEKLEKYFRLGVTWIDPHHETKVDVVIKSNSDKEYKLRIYIPADFPNSCPALVVVQPAQLILNNGSRLPEGSPGFHTFPDTCDYHRICHFHPKTWTQDITLYEVFMKGQFYKAYFTRNIMKSGVNGLQTSQKLKSKPDWLMKQYTVYILVVCTFR